MRFGSLIGLAIFLICAVIMGVVITKNSDPEKLISVFSEASKDFTNKKVTLKDDAPQELIYVPTYKNETSHDRFGNLFDNYNDCTGELLNEVFSNYLMNSYEFAGTPENKEAFSFVISTYVDQLFKELSLLKGGNSDVNPANTAKALRRVKRLGGERISYGNISPEEVRELFAKTESAAYDTLYSFVMGIVVSPKTYVPSKADAEMLLHTVAESNVARKTLLIICENSECVSAFNSGYKMLSSETRAIIESVLHEAVNTPDTQTNVYETAVGFMKLTGVK